jgi:hypothetical protein
LELYDLPMTNLDFIAVGKGQVQDAPYDTVIVNHEVEITRKYLKITDKPQVKRIANQPETRPRKKAKKNVQETDPM